MAVQDGVRDPHDALQPSQSLLIDFVSAHQIRVIAKIAQEPIEFPQSPRRAIKLARKRMRPMFFGLEDRKSDGEEWPLGMPVVKGSIDAN